MNSWGFVPEKLIAENFITYDRLELDFTKLGRRVAVHGPTGAGKTTAFVDALTFALFGAAYEKSGAQFREKLAKEAGRPVKVELTFRVGGERYKVMRMIDSNGKYIRVELRRLEEGAKPITSLREVNQRIEKLLGMNYKIFLNTVAVRQGNVAELLHGLTPSEFRQMLLLAFGIDFRKIQDAVKDDYRQAEVEYSKITSRIEDLRKKIKEKDKVLRDLNNLRKELTKLNEDISKVRSKLQEVEQKLQAVHEKLSSARQEYKLMEKEYQNLQDKRRHLEEKMSDRERFMRELSKLSEIEEELKLLRESISKLRKATGILATIKEKRRALSRYERELRELERKEKELNGLRKRIEDLSCEISALESTVKKIEDIERKIDEKKELKNKLSGKREYLERNLAEIKEMKQRSSNGAIKCPLCLSELSPQKVEEVMRSITHTLTELRNQLESISRELEELSRERETVKKAEEKLNTLYKMLMRYEGQAKSLSEFVKKKVDLQGEREKCGQELKKMEEELSKLIEGICSYDEVEQKLAELEAKERALEEKVRKIAESRGRISELEKEIERLKNEIRELEPLISEEMLRRKKIELDELMKMEDELKRRKKEIESELEGLQDRMIKVSADVKALESKLKEIKDAENEIKSLEIEERKAREKLIMLKVLKEKVFHDQGFPMFLLSRFITRLQDYANYYLSSILPNYQIRLKRVKEGRQEKIRATVMDISRGYDRPLYTYSGGETAILGFVLRLALAKTLLEVKGAKSPRILILDEGFSSASEEYRAQLMKLLATLSQEFENIIVISHVPDIKFSEIFDRILEVQRDRSGSRIRDVTTSVKS
ncbi:MAG: AAA family ATPase [Candidatus Baldrarchaeia archaeon]